MVLIWKATFIICNGGRQGGSNKLKTYNHPRPGPAWFYYALTSPEVWWWELIWSINNTINDHAMVQLSCKFEESAHKSLLSYYGKKCIWHYYVLNGHEDEGQFGSYAISAENMAWYSYPMVNQHSILLYYHVNSLVARRCECVLKMQFPILF